MFNFYLDKVYAPGCASKAKTLKKEGRKIPNSYYNPKETAIYIANSLCGYVKVNTGYKIKAIDFDVANQKVKTRDSKSVQLQLTLNKIKDDCMIALMEAQREEKVLTKYDIKEFMERMIRLKDWNSNLQFFEVFDKFLEWKKKQVSPKTFGRYEVFKRYLKSFEKERRRPLFINNLDQHFAAAFTDFLISKHNLVQNSYIKYLKMCRAFGRFCNEFSYSDSVKYRQIKATGHGTSVFVLTKEEIKAIANLKIKNELLAEVRDGFLFMSYTSVRYSDLEGLKWEDLVTENGYLCYRLFARKTKSVVPIYIPLLPEAIKLVEARKQRGSEKVFNVPSNYEMNDSLKQIARMAKIGGQFTVVRRKGREVVKIVKNRADMVTTHVGRKTFITNALINGLSPDVIRRITGHSTYSAMLPYINIADKYVAEQLFSTHTNK